MTSGCYEVRCRTTRRSDRDTRCTGTKIGVPALVVGGADEAPVLQRGYEATPRRFTAPCDVRILDGAGHWPHRENEDAFLEALLAFLAD